MSLVVWPSNRPQNASREGEWLADVQVDPAGGYIIHMVQPIVSQGRRLETYAVSAPRPALPPPQPPPPPPPPSPDASPSVP